MLGLVAFAFGIRTVGISDICQSNKDLARAVRQIVHDNNGHVAVVVQHEVDENLDFGEIRPEYYFVVSKHRQPGTYLDSEEVMAQAIEFLRGLGVIRPGVCRIQSLFVVAQPFLHLTKCRHLASKAGFQVIPRPLGRIRFDRHSSQWWTRSWHQLLWYAILQKLFGRRGH